MKAQAAALGHESDASWVVLNLARPTSSFATP